MKNGYLKQSQKVALLHLDFLMIQRYVLHGVVLNGLGHTVVERVCRRDNCYFIDVGSCFNGRLAVLDIIGLGI